MMILGVVENRGIINVNNNNGKLAAAITSTNHGGIIGVNNNNGDIVAMIAATSRGGSVDVSNNNGELVAGIHPDNEHAGSVSVNNDKSEPKVIIGIDRYGNGAIDIWDKNGDVRSP